MRERHVFRLALFPILILFLTLMSTQHRVLANYNQTSPEFSVDLSNIPGQMDTDRSMWRIKTEPGKRFGGAVYITNFSDTTATYKVSIEQGFTNNFLLVGYKNGRTNNSLPHNMRLDSVATLPTKIIKIPANSTTWVPVNFKMSKSSFEGVIVGAIVVTKEVPKKIVKQSGFTNAFSYVKGVSIYESDAPSQAQLVEQRGGKLKIMAHKQVFNLRLANNNPAYIANLNVRTNIRDKNKKIVAQDKQTGRQIAPNSDISYDLKLTNSLPAGRYHYQVLMTNEETKQKWKFTGEFTVTHTNAINPRITRTIAFIPFWLWLLIGLLVVAIGLLIILLRREHNKQKKEIIK